MEAPHILMTSYILMASYNNDYIYCHKTFGDTVQLYDVIDIQDAFFFDESFLTGKELTGTEREFLSKLKKQHQYWRVHKRKHVFVNGHTIVLEIIPANSIS